MNWIYFFVPSAMACSYLSLVIFYCILHFPHLIPMDLMFVYIMDYIWQILLPFECIILPGVLHIYLSIYFTDFDYFSSLIYSSAHSFLPSKSWHFLIQICSCKRNLPLSQKRFTDTCHDSRGESLPWNSNAESFEAKLEKFGCLVLEK